MATLQHLTTRQIDEVIRGARDRCVPATVTVRGDQGWKNLRARVVDAPDEHLFLEMFEARDGQDLWPFQPADKVGVSFKLKHHKHIFTATVAGVEQVPGEDGQTVRRLRVCSPTKMHRMQRRAFLRAPVPPNRVVRASYWLGGCDGEPASGSDEPVWSGRIEDISAGGFQMISTDGANDALETGDTVGVRVSFGAGEETAYADAQFRHRIEADGHVHLGFQFVGMAQSPQGRRTLQQIGNKVSQFQRELNALEAARR